MGATLIVNDPELAPVLSGTHLLYRQQKDGNLKIYDNRNLWNFQGNMKLVASESLRNDFAEQMFTPKLSKIPEQFWKKKLPSSYHKNNDALKERCAGNKVGK